jgi:predicted dehydrogenase
MADAARANNLFLMEAIWSRFLPAYVELRRLVSSGRIGELRMVEASFGFRAPFVPTHRLFALQLGGGALLDVGLYPVQLAHMLLGPPDQVTAAAEIGETGVDEQIAVVMAYADGPLAVAMAAIRTSLPSTARINGSDGVIDVPAMLHHPAYLEVRDALGAVERIDTPMEGNGLHYQAEEVHRCLRAGLRESAVMPLADSCAIAHTLDRAREQIGLRYPGE